MMRGQAGLEFVAVMGFVILFFAIASLAISQYSLQVDAKAESVDASRLAAQISSIASIASASTGYRSEFDVPGSLFGGAPYSVIVGNASVIVSFEGQRGFINVSAPHSAYAVTNNESSGPGFALAAGRYAAYEQGGKVVFEKIG
ncbi:hypothetical protein AUJ14_04170 [Candidatus Micrarchaeota archaeon CG1_02_55_22]|nr:MAG: hypothetical protein AUJ14_04170 [Candidatus Micrarchaeota archaeon CG1_02_55_22]